MSTSTGLNMRYATSADIPVIMTFFREHWGADHIFGRDKELLMWQFAKRDAPFGEAEAPCALTVWDGEILAGMQGLIHTVFRTSAGLLPGVWLCNLMAAADYRKQGVSMQLLSGVHRLPVDVTATMGINPDLVPLYRQMRFTVLDNLPRLILPVDPASFEALTDLSCLNASFKPPLSTLQGRIEPIKRFDTQWEAYFDKVAGSNYFGVERSADFMNWRYVDHPRFNYRSVAHLASDNSIRGIAVYRQESVRNQEESVMRLLEFWAYDYEAAASLAAYLLDEANSQKAAFIDYYGSARAPRDHLEGLGWRPADFWSSPIPALFQPLDRRARIIATAIKVAASSPAKLGMDTDFYLVRSDGDQDRPN